MKQWKEGLGRVLSSAVSVGTCKSGRFTLAGFAVLQRVLLRVRVEGSWSAAQIKGTVPGIQSPTRGAWGDDGGRACAIALENDANARRLVGMGSR